MTLGGSTTVHPRPQLQLMAPITEPIAGPRFFVKHPNDRRQSSVTAMPDVLSRPRSRSRKEA